MGDKSEVALLRDNTIFCFTDVNCNCTGITIDVNHNCTGITSDLYRIGGEKNLIVQTPRVQPVHLICEFYNPSSTPMPLEGPNHFQKLVFICLCLNQWCCNYL